MSEAGKTIRVAIVGAGPGGFYAAEELLKQTHLQIQVDMFDRLPTPYGLVRGGVAPDHQKIKSVTKLFDRTAGRPGFRFMGNVTFGTDVNLTDMLDHYHQVLFSTGADADRRLGVEGEDLPGSHPATDFVAWYNGHPDYRHLKFDLSVKKAAVIGNGNVAMDVVRILAKPWDELAKTDMADYALEALKNSQIKEIYLIGRRGPAQAAFTNPEIRELGGLPGVDLILRPDDMALDPLSQKFLDEAKNPVHRRNMDLLQPHLETGEGGGEGSQEKKIRALFFASPKAVLGQTHTEGLRLERNRLEEGSGGALRAVGTGETEEIDVGLVFRSIGYKGTALPDVPFDAEWGVLPHTEGRVTESRGGAVVPRLYAAGWIKRGPSGVIGTNKPDSIATVKSMLEDLELLENPENLENIQLPWGSGEGDAPPDMAETLKNRGVQVVSFKDWERLNQLETEKGAAADRPRVKFTSIEEMLSALKGL